MTRIVCNFSCGAASAIATKIVLNENHNNVVVAYCETGSEDHDNERFLVNCEKWFGVNIVRLKSEKYSSTWDVWEQKRYIAGIKGAPCTSELKIKQRLSFENDGDVHIFGYTADHRDAQRFDALLENWPEINARAPLIENGITKTACIAMLQQNGIKPPRIYSLGFHNANCIPCCKAKSPSYWALVRKEFPVEFNRMSELSRRLGARLTELKGERAFIDEIPEDQDTTKAISPECDMLCQLAEQLIK